MNNRDVKVGRVGERLAALHGTQFMAEIHQQSSQKKKYDSASLLGQELKAQCFAAGCKQRAKYAGVFGHNDFFFSILTM